MRGVAYYLQKSNSKLLETVSVLLGLLGNKIGIDVWSILKENKIGIDAFRAAFDLTKGNRTRGAILMFLHGAWCWGMAVGWPSLMTLFDGLESWQGVVAFKVVHQGLTSVGDVINWVVLVVYYYDCKNSRRENKNSTEVMER
ncbi:hypothetical protein PanWU01x14_160490 [Parasponia andersonii]|uniref:Transmembrane protein n=1 Tax=Parasponia andersonii TaxID=3476 RepID=A0A2P5CE17_PARAD|nr:hypothetical protein PanWU01x14_160490 [Parasponia andersonii]